MAIIRHVGKLEDHYTMIPNDFSRDARVTPRAARVYIFIASQSAGWSLNSRSIATQLDMGRDSVNRALRELEELGWLSRVQQVDEGNRFSNIVYEVSTVACFSGHGESRIREFPSTGNPGHIKKTNSFKKTNSSKNTNTCAREIDPNWKPDDLQMKKLRDRYPQHALEDELKKFIDWYQQKGIERKDWYRSFDNWLKKVKPERPKFSTVDVPDPYGLENAPF